MNSLFLLPFTAKEILGQREGQICLCQSLGPVSWHPAHHQAVNLPGENY